MRTLPYIGKSEYCYANSIAMLLRGLGESLEPGSIEVMTGMGVGAAWNGTTGMLLFDCSAPDVGITRALTQLGFEFEETAQDDPEVDPIPGLIDRLQTGPVLLGPLDLGLLPYNPFTRGERGADHYVAAYAADAGTVYLHDPWGFPCIPLAFPALRAAWQAETVPYRRGYFRSWQVMRRRERPDATQLVERALTLFRSIYESDSPALRTEGFLTGAAAICHVAELIDAGALGEQARDFLTGFSLPLACRRALDMAQFLLELQPAMARLKTCQAALLGQTQVALMGHDGDAGQCLADYAEYEATFESLVLGPG